MRAVADRLLATSAVLIAVSLLGQALTGLWSLLHDYSAPRPIYSVSAALAVVGGVLALIAGVLVVWDYLGREVERG